MFLNQKSTNIYIHFIHFVDQFPGLKKSDRFNITIRAVSNYGKGIPIFVDLRGANNILDENYTSNASMQRDPRLGISIGILLSVLCVMACAFIIIRHRRCSKSSNHQHINGNGGNAVNTFSNRSPNRGQAAGATALIATTSASQLPNCNMDAHEMQTLIIPSSNNIDSIVSITNGNGATKNGNGDLHMNGAVAAASNRHSFSTTNTHSTDDEHSDLSRCGLISSTPKSKHKSLIVQNGEHLQQASTNFGVHVAPLATNSIDVPPYRHIDGDAEANLFCIDAIDQQMNTTLPPPNKSVHSIMYNNSNEIPPTIKRLPNTTAAVAPAAAAAQATQSTAKTTKRSSANASIASIASILDDSQQCLLTDPNATESSSASTSSGCVPMDRIGNNTNCIFDLNTFDNNVAAAATTPHAIVESQRYMRSAALV